MSEKKHCVEVYFDDEEIAILEDLATRINWSIERLLYETVFRAHLNEKAKRRHESARWLRSQEPIDWGADWAELKEWMAKYRALQTLKSMGQDSELPQ